MPPHRGIDQLYASWGEAFRRTDVDAIAELLTPDYVLWAVNVRFWPRISILP
jgi:ketosteroid isomerase-like protein